MAFSNFVKQRCAKTREPIFLNKVSFVSKFYVDVRFESLDAVHLMGEE